MDENRGCQPPFSRKLEQRHELSRERVRVREVAEERLITETKSTRGQLGQGIYSLAELRLYLAFYADERAGDSALRWLNHALNPVAHRSRQPDYSFSDLVSLMMVRELVRHDVPLRRIRAGEDHLRRMTGEDRPFATQEILVVNRRLYARSEIEGQIESTHPDVGQQTAERLLEPYLERVRYIGGRAVTWSPIDGVVLDPEVQFGEPVIEGTRVPTAAIAEVADAAGASEAAERLGIEAEAARVAVRFERKLAKLA